MAAESRTLTTTVRSADPRDVHDGVRAHGELVRLYLAAGWGLAAGQVGGCTLLADEASGTTVVATRLERPARSVACVDW